MPAGAGVFSVLSDKPKVPKYPTIDWEKEQIANAKANEASLAYLKPFAEKTNDFLQEENTRNLKAALPGGYDNIQQNILSALKGELPADVENMIKRKSAEMGIATGTSGSQFSKFDALRNLGLTSLQRSDYGTEAAQRWMAFARAPQVDIRSMFVSPELRIQSRLMENQMQFQRDWMKAKIHAIPWGWKAVLGNMANAATDDVHQWGQMMAQYGSSSMTGGGGGGASGGAMSGAMGAGKG